MVKRYIVSLTNNTLDDVLFKLKLDKMLLQLMQVIFLDLIIN